MELVITDCALDSLGDIADYIIFHFSEKIARKTLDEIFRKVRTLGMAPRVGVFVSSSEQDGELRFLVIKHNYVYYRIKGEIVEIIAVWDCRRSREELFEKILHFLESHT